MDQDPRTPQERLDEAAAQREADEERAGLSTIARVSSDAVERMAADLNAEGGRMIAGFVMCVADGVEPNGGMWFAADEDGPQDPHDILAFILHGAQDFARRNGLPFMLGEIPEGGGQG